MSRPKSRKWSELPLIDGELKVCGWRAPEFPQSWLLITPDFTKSEIAFVMARNVQRHARQPPSWRAVQVGSW